MNNLKKVRTACNLTQSELAQASGVSLRMIQQYEIEARNINRASAETVYKLAQSLNCKIEDIIDKEKITE